MHWKVFHFHTIFSFVESHHNSEKEKMPKGLFFSLTLNDPWGLFALQKSNIFFTNVQDILPRVKNPYHKQMWQKTLVPYVSIPF